MATLELILPQKLETDQSSLTPTYGKFIAEPFEKGYGHTVGHSLRRILLSSLEGSAVTSVRIKGAPHEFASLKGVQEDVMNVLLNVRRLRFKLHSAGPETLTLKIKREGEIKAKDIQLPSQVKVLNPNAVIASLDSGIELDMELEVRRGRGYVSADQLKKEGQPINTIPVDALFSPVTKVHYEVENARVGQMTDYDRLVVEVWTDGSISPLEAVSQAATILKNSLSVFVPFEEKEETSGEVSPTASVVVDQSRAREMFDQPVEMIELSVRASNCLKIAKIKTIRELVTKTEQELLDFKNFGQKSLDEIKDRLKELNLGLGMSDQ
jgi:DNA-directed RNA polymerase subunit alpha